MFYEDLEAPVEEEVEEEAEAVEWLNRDSLIRWSLTNREVKYNSNRY